MFTKKIQNLNFKEFFPILPMTYHHLSHVSTCTGKKQLLNMINPSGFSLPLTLKENICFP